MGFEVLFSRPSDSLLIGNSTLSSDAGHSFRPLYILGNPDSLVYPFTSRRPCISYFLALVVLLLLHFYSPFRFILWRGANKSGIANSLPIIASHWRSTTFLHLSTFHRIRRPRSSSLLLPIPEKLLPYLSRDTSPRRPSHIGLIAWSLLLIGSFNSRLPISFGFLFSTESRFEGTCLNLHLVAWVTC